MSQSFDQYCTACKWDPCICNETIHCKKCGEDVPGPTWQYHLGSYWHASTCPVEVEKRKLDLEDRMAKMERWASGGRFSD